MDFITIVSCAGLLGATFEKWNGTTTFAQAAQQSLHQHPSMSTFAVIGIVWNLSIVGLYLISRERTKNDRAS